MLNPEHMLVPSKTSPLPPGPWLVFAPHPDDETFGMGGSLLRARDEGIETHVIVMTDGALGGNLPDLVNTRQQEVHRAIELLGVQSLQCWSEPDRGLMPSEQLIFKIVQAITELGPTSVFFPGAMELHPDHRTTASLVWKALQQLQRGGEAPQPYSYEISVQSPTNLLIDITGRRAAKEKVMAVYASQNSQIGYPALILALDKARTYTLPETISHAEAFYQFASEDLDLDLFEVMHRAFDLYR